MLGSNQAVASSSHDGVRSRLPTTLHREQVAVRRRSGSGLAPDRDERHLVPSIVSGAEGVVDRSGLLDHVRRRNPGERGSAQRWRPARKVQPTPGSAARSATVLVEQQATGRPFLPGRSRPAERPHCRVGLFATRRSISAYSLGQNAANWPSPRRLRMACQTMTTAGAGEDFPAHVARTAFRRSPGFDSAAACEAVGHAESTRR